MGRLHGGEHVHADTQALGALGADRGAALGDADRITDGPDLRATVDALYKILELPYEPIEDRVRRFKPSG